MKKFIALLTVLCAFSLAEAQTFKVIKIQGKKAIVEVNDPTMVNVNQTYNVGGDSSSMAPYPTGKTGGRDHGIALNFSFVSRSSPTQSSMALGGTYLWNFKKWEAGPTVELTNSSGSGITTNSTTVGGVGFWNFNENRIGIDKILSVTGGLGITSGSGSSSTVLYVGPNYRMFMLSQDHCFSMSAVYQMAQTSGATASGFLLTAGIATYY